jgi:hypothetical protein
VRASAGARTTDLTVNANEQRIRTQRGLGSGASAGACTADLRVNANQERLRTTAAGASELL